MKPFSTYQYVDGEPMTERDKKEVGSKFWNQGKWDNFVLPFLPADCKEMSLVDMGCNAGIFLKLAEDRGFEKVIGVDSDPGAIDRAHTYRTRNGGNYEIVEENIQNVITKLPVVDYTILANVHYYFSMPEWLEYLDQLKAKTRYCIIVTAEKKPSNRNVSADPGDIVNYFKEWREYEPVTVSAPDDPHPRKLRGLLFQSPILKRVQLNTLDNGNAQQRGFLEELDKGIEVFQTRYYKRLRDYRKRTTSKQKVWTDDELTKYMRDRVTLYEDIKRGGIREPILVRADNNRIIDGNHRHDILRHLGYKTVLVRKI